MKMWGKQIVAFAWAAGAYREHGNGPGNEVSPKQSNQRWRSSVHIETNILRYFKSLSISFEHLFCFEEMSEHLLKRILTFKLIFCH